MLVEWISHCQRIARYRQCWRTEKVPILLKIDFSRYRSVANSLDKPHSTPALKHKVSLGDIDQNKCASPRPRESTQRLAVLFGPSLGWFFLLYLPKSGTSSTGSQLGVPKFRKVQFWLSLFQKKSSLLSSSISFSVIFFSSFFFLVIFHSLVHHFF